MLQLGQQRRGSRLDQVVVLFHRIGNLMLVIAHQLLVHNHNQRYLVPKCVQYRPGAYPEEAGKTLPACPMTKRTWEKRGSREA